MELLFYVARDLPYVCIRLLVITLYEILVWFRLIDIVLCYHTFQVHTDIRLVYIKDKFAMFEIGIAAPHQTLWDLFWDVRSSCGGYHISYLVNRQMFQVSDVYLMVVSNYTPHRDVSVPKLSWRIPDWRCCHGTPLYLVCITIWYYLQGCFRFCGWLSLWCLVPWIDCLPLYFGPLFGKTVLGSSLDLR